MLNTELVVQSAVIFSVGLELGRWDLQPHKLPSNIEANIAFTTVCHDAIWSRLGFVPLHETWVIGATVSIFHMCVLVALFAQPCNEWSGHHEFINDLSLFCEPATTTSRFDFIDMQFATVFPKIVCWHAADTVSCRFYNVELARIGSPTKKVHGLICWGAPKPLSPWKRTTPAPPPLIHLVTCTSPPAQGLGKW